MLRFFCQYGNSIFTDSLDQTLDSERVFGQNSRVLNRGGCFATELVRGSLYDNVAGRTQAASRANRSSWTAHLSRRLCGSGTLGSHGSVDREWVVSC